MKILHDKVVIVTGAASGMGYDIAMTFMVNGAKVIGFSLEKLSIDLSFDYVQGDVTCIDDCQRAVDYVLNKYGRIDGLVNSAGISHEGNLLSTDLEELKKVFEVNFYGTFNMCKACMPLLVGKKTSIVNISSNMATKAIPNRVAYNPSKAAMNMFTECLAIDFAPDVRVNTIMPGIVDTPMIRKRLCNVENPEQLLKEYNDIYLLKRIGTTEDISSTALFLMSDQSSWITGAHIPVCGGDQL